MAFPVPVPIISVIPIIMISVVVPVSAAAVVVVIEVMDDAAAAAGEHHGQQGDLDDLGKHTRYLPRQGQCGSPCP
ncbi:hypothetical protein D9M71_809580 [compost metagenome]